jgi:transcriptional regulator with XRE-family HTH domain
METKVQNEWIDTGFGFPVKLTNVTMIKVRGNWTPQLDYNALAINKHSRLTGNEIKFIRTYFEMTLQAFAKRFCVTHVAVMKWERTQASTTVMNWTTEKDVRLFVLAKLSVKSSELASLYNELERLPREKASPLRLDAKHIAA